jgi:uncharacterized protein (DUF302 family)
MTPEGLTICASSRGPDETLRRLEDAINSRGMTVFARIDHAAAAAEVGLRLRPTTVLIFGSARAGTPLMQTAQTMGIDLPLKALVWQDAESKTWIAYNDPTWLAKRHGVEAAAAVAAMTNGLVAISQEAGVAPG